MTPQKVIIATDLEQSLAEAVAECEHDKLFILADETTEKLCLPIIAGFQCVQGAQTITIGATDANKTLQSLSHVWEALGQGGATRHSLLINIGGGMVTDLGGFAASTFKRGINYINIPTTLLSMVDASVGGKTGINFQGLKNEIGVFNNASSVILDTQFLQTMDYENILSGYAEMLKHGLISNEPMWAELLKFEIENLKFEVYDHSDTEQITNFKFQTSNLKLKQMLADSVAVKQRIVTEDPTEQGIRKALNLGHTVGHAFESFALRTMGTRTMGTVPSVSSAADYRGTVPSVRPPQLHGYFVAFGLICELYLSAVKCSFPTDKMHQTVSFIKEHYGKMAITCDDYPILLELMTHDKKNVGSAINFTLLGGIGDIRINQNSDKQEIYEALDFYREC